jgi:hypothetical protein
MRYSMLALALLGTACARLTWQGTQTLSRDVSAPSDSVLVAAVQALRDHGYDARIVGNQTIVTAPKAVPQFTRPVSTAADTMPDSWILQVDVQPNQLRAGTTLAVSAFLIPRASQRSADTTQKRLALPVNSSQPVLMQEVERIGNWIVEATAARKTP